jgi:hypothetical protein
MTIPTVLRAGVLAGIVAVAAACGTGTPATPGTDATPTAPAVGTPGEQPPAQTPGQQPGGGHDVQDPCGLATIEEVSAALGVDVVEVEAITGDSPTYCNYKTADGTNVLATSYSIDPVNQAVFDSFAGDEDAVAVPGLADAATYSDGVLFIKRGDAVVGIQPLTSSIEQIRVEDDPDFELSEQDILTFLTQIGQAVAGRL